MNPTRKARVVTQEDIYSLWDALADFPAADVDAAMTHLTKTLSDWIGADNVVWVGAVHMRHGAEGKRDLQNGWRGRVVKLLHPSPELSEKSKRIVREQDTEPALSTIAITAAAGRFRAHRLRDGFVDFERFRRTAHYQAFYQNMQLTDRIWTVVPVNEDTESYFLFDRYRTRKRFTQDDADLVGHVLRSLKWFHRLLMLSHGVLIADTPLTKYQRRVLSLLLTDAREADIAAKLKLSKGTVHQYAVELYRKLDVKGRAGLMSLWLGPQTPVNTKLQR